MHDSALEGEVLTYGEIKAATDRNIISDVSLIPSYEDIKAFDAASAFGLEYASNRKKPINLELIRGIFSELSPDEAEKGCPYRKENPLHRLYYHEISQPDKVGYRMRKLSDWLDASERKSTHPIERAVETHRSLMSIFPWAKGTGRVARILSNSILSRHDYPMAVIHSIDRQRYYDALRTDDNKLELLYLEAVETTQKIRRWARTRRGGDECVHRLRLALARARRGRVHCARAHAGRTGHHSVRGRRRYRCGIAGSRSRPEGRQGRAGSRSRGHSHERGVAADREDRRCGAAFTHRAQPQRSGGDGPAFVRARSASAHRAGRR